MKFYLILFLLCYCIQLDAQVDSALSVPVLKQNEPSLHISSFLEVYYLYDFNKPENNNRANYFYSHTRHNEFNINLSYFKAAYSTRTVRANVTLAAGTYMNVNYNNEPSTFKNIYEANAGIKIGKNNLWLDAGILPSHIGFESAVSKDNWTLTRTLLAENTPYYEAGAKISFTSLNDKWFLSGLLLNGWQHIQRLQGNSLISFGTQVQFKPNAFTTFNYSTFVGSDKPDTNRLMRYYNNFYTIFNLNKRIGLTLGLDYGLEQKLKGQHNNNNWWSVVNILKYAVNEQFAMAVRIEYYNDKEGVLINHINGYGFQTAGYSFNIDYQPLKQALLRVELRSLHSSNPIFRKGNSFINFNNFVTSSLAVSF